MVTHETWMEQAFREAEKAFEKGEVPIGAVIVEQDRIIGRGHNMVERLQDPTAHAEVLALRAASRALGNYRLPNTTLCVTIEPCIMCMGALLHARVARIVFGAKDPKWGGAGTHYNLAADTGLNHTIDVQGGLLENECRELMQDFFRTKRLGVRGEYGD